MDRRDESLIETVLDQNSELKNLWNQHLKFEQRLNKIQRKPFLTDEEKVEKKRIKLAKLAGKTRIEEILTNYRSEYAMA